MTNQPARDLAGVALYRHEAIGALLQVRKVEDEMRLCVLVSHRKRPPFAGYFALPSGAVEADEGIGDSVLRHLSQKFDVAGLTYLEQLDTRSDPFRDPAQRTIGTSYLGLAPLGLTTHLPSEAEWISVAQTGHMAFDHADIVTEAVSRLRAKLSYTNIGFALVPEEFTIGQLRSVYVAALGHSVAATNLQRVLTRRGQLVRTDKFAQPDAKGGRPARLFKFATRQLVVTDPFAVLRPE